MKNQIGYINLQMIIVIVGLFGAWGWVWNIVKLVHSTFDPLTGMVVARAIGIFVAPLGAVLGFM
jgi:hypothetical protein